MVAPSSHSPVMRKGRAPSQQLRVLTPQTPFNRPLGKIITFPAYGLLLRMPDGLFYAEQYRRGLLPVTAVAAHDPASAAPRGLKGKGANADAQDPAPARKRPGAAGGPAPPRLRPGAGSCAFALAPLPLRLPGAAAAG